MGVYLSKPNKEKKIEKGESSVLKWVSIGMQGWRVKMEDTHISQCNVANDVSIFGVFDGHGGKEVAIYVKNHFVETLLKNENFAKKDYQQALYQTFLDMDVQISSPKGHEEIQKYREQEEGESMAGCTANVCLITKTEIYIANAGDSRSVLRQNKQTVQLSEDHKPELVEENKRIIAAGGYVMEGRINGNLNLSRALGDLEYKQDKKLKPEQQIISAAPEIIKRTLSKDDKFLIIGCDGIWEKLSNDQICEFVEQRLNKGVSLEDTVSQFLDDNLAQDTSQGVGCDNMTAIIVQFKN